MPRLARFLDGKEPLPAKSVVITIDDGYRSTYEIAYPILRKFGFPATVFLYTDFVGASDAMTWAQMKEMIGSGLVTIQPHSKSHANLTLRLPGESEARYQGAHQARGRRAGGRAQRPPGRAAASRSRTRTATSTSTWSTCWSRTASSQGVTVTPGGNPFYAYPYMLRRSMVFGNEDLDTFKAKLVTFVRTASR